MEGGGTAEKGSLTSLTREKCSRLADLPMSLSNRPVAGWGAVLALLWALELLCSSDGFPSTLTAERDRDRCRCRSSCLSDVVPTSNVVVVLSVARVRRRASPSFWMGPRPVPMLRWAGLRGVPHVELVLVNHAVGASRRQANPGVAVQAGAVG